MKHHLFQELLEFCQVSYDLSKPSPARSLGMQLHLPPLMNGGYEMTPTNSREFANTGNEGTHYNFLLLDGEVRGDSPIVMTVPGNGMNIVLGENLHDFLCFGIGLGFGVLEDLAYKSEEFLQQYPAPGEFAPWVEPEQRETLRCLAERFSLTAWTDVEDKLVRLDRTSFPMLHFSKQCLRFGLPQGVFGTDARLCDGLGRKLMKFHLIRGCTRLGIVTEDEDRSQAYGFPWFLGRFVPSPGFSEVKPLFDKKCKLSEADDKEGASQVLRELLAPGMLMTSVDAGEEYSVTNIWFDDDDIVWTPYHWRSEGPE
jgi:hypothetical protein